MNKKLLLREEKFCQLLAAGVHPKTGKPITQSDAYRLAYNPRKTTKQKSIHEKASFLSNQVKIRARVDELLKPVVEQVQVTREQWLKKMEGYFHSDVRKMFTGPGNAIDIHELGDNEALMVEGYELVENFEKVGDKAEHVGYTKKVKLTPKLKAMLEFGKVMGWYTEKKEIDLGATLEELVLGSMKK